MIRALIDKLVAPSVERLVKQVPTCEHKWSEIDCQTLRYLGQKDIGTVRTLRCEKCGDITHRHFWLYSFQEGSK